ncbi:MAG: ATP-binding protein [Actinomycetota bacterium]|nr:ATP-binding protein [Actinomycetota bacterium]
MPIRLRLAGLFALGTAVLIAATGLLFARQLEAGLLSSVDGTLRPRGEATAQLVSVGLPSPAAEGVDALGGSLTQVLDPSGVVVGATSDAGRLPLVSPADMQRAEQGPFSATRALAARSDSSFAGEVVRLRLMPVPRSDGRWLVVVGASTETVENAVGRVRQAVGFGGPPIVLLAGLAAWLVAGGALRPVERMRREVAEISEHGGGAGVDVPPTRDEIARLAVTMNAVLGRLRRALDRERRFVADAGHELRTPLSILQGELELAGRRGRTKAELAAAVEAASMEVRRLSQLAEELLALGRDAGAAPQLAPVAPAAVIRDSCNAFRALAAASSVRLVVELDESLRVQADARRLRRAVDNLLGNALRFAPHGTEITLSVVRSGADAVLEVGDRGPGFPADFLPHAFERFRRVDDAHGRRGGGTGLGLALVQAVAVGLGGQVRAANRDGGGAIVGLRLPLSDAEVYPT